MSQQLKPCLLADVEWLHLGSTHEYKDVKKFIADICYDVASAACIDEICINDICVGFRQRGYEVIAKCDLDALRAKLAAKDAEIERLRDRNADLEQYIKKAIGDISDAIDDLSHAKISLQIALKGGAQ